jgi:hypothetical protein
MRSHEDLDQLGPRDREMRYDRRSTDHLDAATARVVDAGRQLRRRTIGLPEPGMEVEAAGARWRRGRRER